MQVLQQANNARLANALSKLYRYSYGVATLKQHLDNHAISFSTEQVPKYEYNRRKFNNMNYDEQAAYELKLKEVKTIYVANYKDGAYSEIPKMVYEYYTN